MRASNVSRIWRKLLSSRRRTAKRSLPCTTSQCRVCAHERADVEAFGRAGQRRVPFRIARDRVRRLQDLLVGNRRDGFAAVLGHHHHLAAREVQQHVAVGRALAIHHVNLDARKRRERIVGTAAALPPRPARRGGGRRCRRCGRGRGAGPGSGVLRHRGCARSDRRGSWTGRRRCGSGRLRCGRTSGHHGWSWASSSPPDSRRPSGRVDPPAALMCSACRSPAVSPRSVAVLQQHPRANAPGDDHEAGERENQGQVRFLRRRAPPAPGAAEGGARLPVRAGRRAGRQHGGIARTGNDACDACPATSSSDASRSSLAGGAAVPSCPGTASAAPSRRAQTRRSASRATASSSDRRRTSTTTADRPGSARTLRGTRRRTGIAVPAPSRARESRLHRPRPAGRAGTTAPASADRSPATAPSKTPCRL